MKKLIKTFLQAALVICRLFICDFAYMRLKNGLFSGTYPLIHGNPWSFYMRIYYIGAYFWSPYLLNITSSTCTYLRPVFVLTNVKMNESWNFNNIFVVAIQIICDTFFLNLEYFLQPNIYWNKWLNMNFTIINLYFICLKIRKPWLKFLRDTWAKSHLYLVTLLTP